MDLVKKYWAWIALAVVAAYCYYKFYMTPATATPATTVASLPGAVDAADSAAAQQIIADVQASQFATSLSYPLGNYKLYYAPGMPGYPGGDWGLIDGKQYMTGGLMQAVWVGIVCGVSSNPQVQGAPPINGHTQADADAAYALGQTVAGRWIALKNTESIAQL